MKLRIIPALFFPCILFSCDNLEKETGLDEVAPNPENPVATVNGQPQEEGDHGLDGDAMDWGKASTTEAFDFINEAMKTVGKEERELSIQVGDVTNQFLLVAPDPNEAMYLGRLTHTSAGYKFNEISLNAERSIDNFSKILELLNEAKTSSRVKSGAYFIEISVTPKVTLIDFHQNVQVIKNIYPDLKMILTLNK